MKRVVTFLMIIMSFLLGTLIGKLIPARVINNPVVTKVIPKPYEKYTVENLSQGVVQSGTFDMSMKLAENDDYVSYLFHLRFNPGIDSVYKTTEGQINFPVSKDLKSYPIIIMMRGYIIQETYKVGDGTRRAAEVYAKNGFITLAPDFLGYGGSDNESENIFETRFQTYTTILSLLKSIDQIPNWDGKNIFIWGHSNGGQIALTVLEITGEIYPTSLWAPVSKPFPYSVLYYTDESVDGGKLIRKELAKFEELYDTDLYSLTNYLDRINAPLIIHQGNEDEAVPINWTDNLVKKLKDNQKDITYFTYPDTNHNMTPAWNTVVSRDLEFFRKHIK